MSYNQCKHNYKQSHMKVSRVNGSHACVVTRCVRPDRRPDAVRCSHEISRSRHVSTYLSPASRENEYSYEDNEGHEPSSLSPPFYGLHNLTVEQRSIFCRKLNLISYEDFSTAVEAHWSWYNVSCITYTMHLKHLRFLDTIRRRNSYDFMTLIAKKITVKKSFVVPSQVSIIRSRSPCNVYCCGRYLLLVPFSWLLKIVQSVDLSGFRTLRRSGRDALSPVYQTVAAL